MKGAAAAITGIAAAALLLFVGLPIVAIFLRVPPSALWAQLHSSVALDALRVSMKTSLVSLAFMVLAGTPVAHLLAVRRFPGRAIVITLVEVPLVLPPAVAGIALFAAFGRSGLLGSHLAAHGIRIPFTWIAVVMAQTFVAMPFYVRQVIASFGAVDQQLVGASRTLGAGAFRSFFRIEVPLARQGLAAGAALAWARALGEFGATALFAGGFVQGVTQTLPLAIYAEFQGANITACLAMSAFLVAVSFAVLVSTKILLGWRET